MAKKDTGLEKMRRELSEIRDGFCLSTCLPRILISRLEEESTMKGNEDILSVYRDYCTALNRVFLDNQSVISSLINTIDNIIGEEEEEPKKFFTDCKPISMNSLIRNCCENCPNQFDCYHNDTDEDVQLCEKDNTLNSKLISLVLFNSITIKEFNEWALANNEEPLIELPEGFYPVNKLIRK